MNCFVVYTSKIGMTGKIARELSRKFSADMLKVEPKEPYGGFVASVARVAREKARNEQAASGTPYRDFSEYDVVFVGFPIWAGDIPTYMQDFLQNSDFGGTVVIPFASSAFESIERAEKTIRTLCPGARIENAYVSNPRTVNRFPAWLTRLEKQYR